MKQFLFVLLTLGGTSPYVFGQYTNLVFEGAGIRGVAYAGVIQELEHRNLLVNVQRVGGTSAGAIAAMTVSLGYTGKEIEDIIYNVKLQRFNDGKFFFIGGMSRLSHRYGWYRRNGLAPIDIDRFNQYLGAFYNYVLENLNRSGLTDADWKRTVSISSGTIGPKIRKLSVNEKDTLMNNGRAALQHHLASLP